MSKEEKFEEAIRQAFGIDVDDCEVVVAQSMDELPDDDFWPMYEEMKKEAAARRKQRTLN